MSEEREDVVVLTDDDGNETEFEFLSTVEMDGNDYIVLLPIEEEEKSEDEEQEVLILKVSQDEEGEDLFSSIDDEDELDKVFDLFLGQIDDDEEEEEKDEK